MGVPAFFRWLSRKYPSVVCEAVEVKPDEIDGVKVPVDASLPNPNGVEFDNLYLDMNGIIHPCTHPEDKPAPKDEDEMMVAIFECIDRLLAIVRPRKLLYMAIDGVAPRAKMNQQRSRRFRASKETAEKIEEVARVREKLESDGVKLPPPKASGSHFDSNCITPGTPFMDRLSKCLHYYSHTLLNNNPAWKDLKIVLSDANVPGEGEHKIMDFIRKQRAQPDHDPNTKHCLCGADADLIMLGLATHEPNFTIIREEFKPNQPRPCDVCGKLGHEMKDCLGLSENSEDEIKVFANEVQFIFVRLYVLREYLRRELEMSGLPFPYDFERAIDDWVFMCFFVGNDFLPHLPSLEIREGAIDRLVGLYKRVVYRTGGWLTDSGQVSLNRVQLIMQELGKVEDSIFVKRQQTELSFRHRNKERKKSEKRAKRKRMAQENPNRILGGQFAPTPVGGAVVPLVNAKEEITNQRIESMESGDRGVKRPHPDSGNRWQNTFLDDIDVSSSEEEEVEDEVRLWEEGFKDRYYESKFDVNAQNITFRHMVAMEYVRGLSWVLRYYYQGCASWKWYFPYHYAPFASDFVNIAECDIEFEKDTQPFKPLEQLMGVFPAASKAHVPEPWGCLMEDPDSPIIDFYPVDFNIDLNGKKFAWQGVALLPFVEEERLFDALKPYYSVLTKEELARNIRGEDRLYMGQSNQKYSYLAGLYDNEKNMTTESSFLSEGMLGRVILAKDRIIHGGELASPVRGLKAIYSNTVITVCYRDPKYLAGHIFMAKRLDGAQDPPTILKPQNLRGRESREWQPRLGMNPSTRQIAHLDIAAHRMLGHQRLDRGPNFGNAIPPPANLYSNQSGSSYHQRGRGGGGYQSRTDRRYQPYSTPGRGHGPSQYDQRQGSQGYGNRNGFDNYNNSRHGSSNTGGADRNNRQWSNGAGNDYNTSRYQGNQRGNQGQRRY